MIQLTNMAIEFGKTRMPQMRITLRSASDQHLTVTGFKTAHSPLAFADDLNNAGTTQWQPAISICVPLGMALSL